jgi:ribosome-associated protein
MKAPAKPKIRVKTKLALDAETKALKAASLLADKKGIDPLVLDLRKITLICDYFVICSGTSQAHMRGLVDYLVEEFEKVGIKSSGVEGYKDAEWVLLDYGDVIIHVLSGERRDFYALEKLWGDAPRLVPPDK